MEYNSTTMRSVLALALLLVTAASQTLTPTNWTSATQSLKENTTISVYIEETSDPFFVSVIPLLAQAASLPSNGRAGGAHLLTEDGTINLGYPKNIQQGDIIVMSCDGYNGELQADGVLNEIETGISSQELPSCILLYTEKADYCNLTGYSDSVRVPWIYSLKNSLNATNLVNKINGNPDGLNGYVAPTIDINNNIHHGSGFPAQPPNTAPAMIILYAITGVVAALFVAIIITGAVRAHRHPERYGPRLVVGRTRQGRAKGLARAMLDTLPIVKFGERESEQPKDIELGETESRTGSTAAGGETQGEDQHATTDTVAATVAANNTTAASQPSPIETSNNDSTRSPTEMQETGESGIGGAVPATRNTTTATEAGGASSGPSQSECAICAEDFEAGQDQRVLPCDHRFHPGCIDPWLLNVSGTCPLCRIDLRPAGSGVEGEDEEAEIDEHGNPIPRAASDTNNTGELPPPIAPQNDPQRISMARALLLTLTHPGGPPRHSDTPLRGLSRHERMEVRRQFAIRRQLEDRRQLALRVARAREENEAAAAAAGDDANASAQQTDGAGDEEQQVRNRTRVMNFLRRARGGTGRSTQQEPSQVTLRVGEPSSPAAAAAPSRGDEQA